MKLASELFDLIFNYDIDYHIAVFSELFKKKKEGMYRYLVNINVIKFQWPHFLNYEKKRMDIL